MSNKIKIRIDNVTKDFPTANKGYLSVLQGINLEVFENEFVCITGPSGCGKTTLLSIIAGLQAPTSGEVSLDGHIIRGPGKDRGVVFQEDAIFLWRNVIRNVEYGLELRKVPKSERRIIAEEYLQLVGLQNFTKFFPKELSGGMKKKVALATVYANDPEILLMDEPFGSLDYPTKCRLQSDLLNIWKTKTKTTIFVTHDVEEALFLSDRIVVIQNGKIAAKYENFFSRPRLDEIRTQTKFNREKANLKKYLE
jgi:NitT/TauT family transport system ATP-binding protein